MPAAPTDLQNATVVKIGGSLLDVTDLSQRLKSVFTGPTLVVVGGGDAANLVREWDRRFDLSAEAAHQLAIRAMSLNAALLAQLDAAFTLVSDVSSLARQPFNEDTICVLDAQPVIADLEASHSPLPRSWNTTSDSIAAWFAGCLGISRLMMLKSVNLSTASNHTDRNFLQDLADARHVDALFPQYAQMIESLFWCNLREDPLVVHRIT